MARYVLRIVPIQLLNPRFPYSCRYRLEDSALEKSILKKGIAHPILISPGAPADVISGHKRLLAAKKAGVDQVEVLQLETALSAEEAFLLAVLSNWNQVMPDLDKAWTVVRASKNFKFTKETILEEIFPALGVSEDSGFYDEAFEVAELNKPLLDSIAAGELPFRGAKVLNRLSKQDQEIFAFRIASQAALTTNQLIKTGEWLVDLLQKSSRDLAAFLTENSALEGLLTGPLDRKAKGERFFSLVRMLRFPNLAEKEKEFAALSGQVREDQSGISVEAPPFFEAEGFTMRAKIRSDKDLEQLSQWLERKRKVLNSLLDIVL